MEEKLLVSDLDVQGKKVLLRVDFNVPLNKEGEITDDTRLRASLKTINSLLDRGASIILLSHLGRPKGRVQPNLSLEPVAKRLGELLQKSVSFAQDCVGPSVHRLKEHLKPGELLLCENLRFHPEEEHPTEESSFAKDLAQGTDLFVNDAFGASHRKHASVTLLPSYFPGKAAMGFLMQEELHWLDKLLKQPEKPFVAILGGAKISSKLGVIKALLKKCDAILIGGGMAFTFLRAQGFEIGDSICEEDLFDEAREILDEAARRQVHISLPTDVIITDSITQEGRNDTIDMSEGISSGYEGVDIGPRTLRSFLSRLEGAKTIFWNGPMGVFEIPAFAGGSISLATFLQKSPAFTFLGGGDTLSLINQYSDPAFFTHLSTGGGASLEYMEDERLVGIEALSAKNVFRKL